MGLLDKFLNSMQLGDDDDYYDDDDEYFDEEDDYEDEEVDEKPRRGLFGRKSSKKDDYYDDEDDEFYDEPAPKSKKAQRAPAPVERAVPAQAPAKNNVTPMRSPRRGGGMEVCVIKPTNMEDAREITETLLSNRTVVLNMEGLDMDIAQRIIDFASGSCFAINGNLQKIANYIFIITPATVDISGDFSNLLTSGGLGSVPSFNGSNF